MKKLLLLLLLLLVARSPKEEQKPAAEPASEPVKTEVKKEAPDYSQYEEAFASVIEGAEVKASKTSRITVRIITNLSKDEAPEDWNEILDRLVSAYKDLTDASAQIESQDGTILSPSKTERSKAKCKRALHNRVHSASESRRVLRDTLGSFLLSRCIYADGKHPFGGKRFAETSALGRRTLLSMLGKGAYPRPIYTAHFCLYGTRRTGLLFRFGTGGRTLSKNTRAPWSV